MQKIKGYWRTEGKHPKGTEETRILLEDPPKRGNYCAVYADGFIQIDIDDYDHKTGELRDPVKGECRSSAVVSLLDSLKCSYDGISTDNGVHLVFRVPEDYPFSNNKINWFCALGVRIEAKVTKPVELLQVNGRKREYFKGGVDNLNIDVLPRFLYPLQKSKEKPFLMEFETGDRNNHFSEYAFYLANKGFSAEDIEQSLNALNSFILSDALPEEEMKTILRPETMEKLKTIEDQKKNGTCSPETFARFLKALGGVSIRYNELSNTVEYGNLPNTFEYQNITDVQNVMPIRLLYDFMRFTGKQNINKRQVVDLIVLDADLNSYNPVKEYLQSVKWDHKDRFPELFDVLGITDQLQQILVRKWFYQTVALAFNTLEKPLQAEGVLILQGAEGIGKTRFFRQIAANPLWFSSLDKELTTNNKDILIQMLSVWVAEIGEVDRTFKANKSDVKNFITKTDDTIRKPYRPEQVITPRTTSFCGTTNKEVFLNDDTGSRRWWIIPISKYIDIDEFTEEKNLCQFWSQCYYTFSEDPKCYLLTEQEKKGLRQMNKRSMELLPAEEELRSRLDFEAPVNYWKWCAPSKLRECPEYDIGRYSPVQIGNALTRIMEDEPNMDKKRNKGHNLYFIPPVIVSDRYGNKT